MKNFYSLRVQATMLCVSLLGAVTAAKADAIVPGQQVTNFIVDEENGLTVEGGTVPLFSTDEELNNWAYQRYGDAQSLSDKDQRAWKGVFEVNAPAAGKYGVEVKLRSTTTNWMVACTSSASLAISDRVSVETAPAWTAMARPTLLSSVERNKVIVTPADTIAPTEEGADTIFIPAVTADVYTFSSGEWETLYVPVELTEGTNYVTFWLCRTYQGIDALTGPEGSINGLYVQSIKVMPQGSGDVAALLQTATLKLWQQRLYPAMNVESGAGLAPAYATLLSAYGSASDYNALDTTAICAGIAAVAEREVDLRHGQGVIIDGDSAVFALPYYHNMLGGAVSENERGEYSDAPMVFEYTNGKTLVYKFTTTVSGTFYPEVYEGSQLSTNAHLTILAADSSTVVMPEWVMAANSGAWQVYQMNSNPVLAKFQAEAGQTYFLTIYFENYVNIRGLYMRQVVQTGKSYAELADLAAKGEDLYAKYQPGTEGFYSIGGSATLLGALEEALAMASDLDESSTSAEITEAYYALDDAIGQIENCPVMNVIPTTENHPFALVNGTFKSWRVEAAGNIGYGYQDGYVVYDVYNTVDQTYDLTMVYSCNGAGAIVAAYVDAFTEEGDTVRVCEKSFEIPEATGWSNWYDYKIEGLNIPEGHVLITIYGEKAGSSNWVGNFNGFTFTGVEGTAGAGSAAFVAGIGSVVANGNAAAGFYNMNGQYVGNDLSKLAKGIYVQAGRKVVK